MKKVLKILLLAVVVAVCALGLVACGDNGGESKTGILYKMYEGDDFYTVYGYVDEGKNVTSIDIGELNTENVTIGRIKTGAFKDNDTLTEIIVPDTVTTIDGGAFKNMKALESITLPFVGASATGDATFNQTNPEENKAVNIERTFAYIFGEDKYEGGTAINVTYKPAASSEESSSDVRYLPLALRNVTVKNSANYKIPMYAFAGNILINSVTLSGGVDEIGEYAFSGAKALQSVKIPATVKTINKYAFSGCVNLKDGLVFENPASSVLTSVKEHAFDGAGLKSIELPASVIEIGENCFANNSLLTNAVISAENVKDAVFYNCDRLKTVTFKASVKSIGALAFSGCDSLTSATFEYTSFNAIGENNSSTALSLTDAATNATYLTDNYCAARFVKA